MESESSPLIDPGSNSRHLASEQLQAVEQAKALVYTRYPPLNRWYPAIIGCWAAAFVASFAAPTWLSTVLMFGLLVAGGAGMRWYIGKRGVMPSLRGAPPAIKREMSVFFVSYAVAVTSVVAVYQLLGWWVASMLAFTTFAVLVAVYEHRYANAARRDEAALGIDPVGGGRA